MSITIVTFLNQILSGINSATGGINDFRVIFRKGICSALNLQASRSLLDARIAGVFGGLQKGGMEEGFFKVHVAQNPVRGSFSAAINAIFFANLCLTSLCWRTSAAVRRSGGRVGARICRRGRPPWTLSSRSAVARSRIRTRKRTGTGTIANTSTLLFSC